MPMVLEHNTRLPLPKDVLPINPRAIMLDGVEELDMGRAVGFWTPTAEQCHLTRDDGSPFGVTTSMVGEVLNQLAAYTLIHGAKEPKIPYLTGVDYMRGRYPIFIDRPIRIVADVKARDNIYTAEGYLTDLSVDKLAYRGLVRGVMLRQEDTWPAETAGTAALPASSMRQREQYQADRSHELYQRIVGVDRIPKQEERTDRPKVNFEIRADNVISVDERVISVNGNRLFILNALLLNLGRELTRAEVEDMGFSPGTTMGTRQANFSNAKNSLLEELKTSEKHPLLLQRFAEKRRGYYQLDPHFGYVFYDRRHES